MDINATLLGQLITFAVFVWFTMKYVWPPITKAMQEREKKIADGLNAAERGHRELELAQHKATEQLRDAKNHAAEILDQAHKRANQIVEEAKERAREEGERLLTIARGDIEQEMQSARQQLRNEVAKLVITGAEKILAQQIDSKLQHALVEKLIAEV
jgi:F-type H+-transporting ATPase subunit b